MLRAPLRRLATRTRAALAVAAPATLAGLTVGGAAPQGRQAPAQNQPPTFRAAANFVQVDVYPTANGRPVGDLTKDEFDVLEDGVLQSVATFEHVSIRPAAPDAPRVDPRSTAEEKRLIADPRNRLFVLFLDTYHVTDPAAWHNARIRMPGSTTESRPREKKPLGPRGIDKALVNFLERAIGPGDLGRGDVPGDGRGPAWCSAAGPNGSPTG